GRPALVRRRSDSEEPVALAGAGRCEPVDPFGEGNSPPPAGGSGGGRPAGSEGGVGIRSLRDYRRAPRQGGGCTAWAIPTKTDIGQRLRASSPTGIGIPTPI